MSSQPRAWVIDRVEEETLVLVSDDEGATVELPRHALPLSARAVREGDVLRVAVGAGGEPDWRGAVVDADARRARLDEARETLDRLEKRDPGGDVRL